MATRKRPLEGPFKGIGAALYRIRKSRGMTQQEVATKAGIKQSMVGSYEREVHDPRLSTLDRLFMGLGITLLNVAEMLGQGPVATPSAMAADAEMQATVLRSLTRDVRNLEKEVEDLRQERDQLELQLKAEVQQLGQGPRKKRQRKET